MKTILRSGWFNVSSFVYAFLMFVGVCCSSLVFGTEMNPLMSPPASAVVSHSRHNPYQAIYDAYLSGRYLDNIMTPINRTNVQRRKKALYNI